jgi:hypothetical protein
VCLLKQLARGGCIFTLSAAEEVKAVISHQNTQPDSTIKNMQRKINKLAKRPDRPNILRTLAASSMV